MSHPENTLKEIINRQNKKIEALIDVLEYTIKRMYYTDERMQTIMVERIRNKLDKVKKL